MFLGLRLAKNATMTAISNEIVTKLLKSEAAMKGETGLIPELLVFANKHGQGGKRGDNGKGGNCPKRDKGGNENDRKKKGSVEVFSWPTRRAYH